MIGASGGIGQALCEALERQDYVVHPLSRRAGQIDLSREQTIAGAAQKLAATGPYHRIIVASGILHDVDLAPERNLRDLHARALARCFAVNAIGPALCARFFLPLLAKDGAFAALSARVGSISDNRLGGWYGYRASKAALNQLIRTAAIELARTAPAARCVTLHPGTVDTGMSRPFQRNVPPGQPSTPGQSAEQLLAVLERLQPSDSGFCFDWRGERIPF